MSTTSPADLQPLLDLVTRLRAPDGCPWDREQTLSDLRPYLLEEAHEVAAAIDGRDWDELANELGDLLFQAAFIGRLAQEQGHFELGDAIQRSLTKMVSRHPHVFGEEKLADAEAVRQVWERRKVAAGKADLLSGIAASLPTLTATYRMTQKAAGVGFDWPNAEAVLEKVDEELTELRAELGAPTPNRDALREELGDLLFTVANLARKLDIDPDAALAQTNLKFRRRFQHIETKIQAQGRTLTDATLEEMDALWEEAKGSPG